MFGPYPRIRLRIRVTTSPIRGHEDELSASPSGAHYIKEKRNQILPAAPMAIEAAMIGQYTIISYPVVSWIGGA
jgi:hypothetical protein